MPVLSARGLRHAYGDRRLFDDISFAIGRSERVGLIGNNGSGKSTLAAILMGRQVPDGGEVVVRGGASVAVLAQEVDFGAHTTPREVIVAGLAAWSDASQRFDAAGAKIESGGRQDAVIKAQAKAAEDIERLGGWEVMHKVTEVAGHLGVADLDKPLDTMSGGERRRVDLTRVLVGKPSLAILDEPTNHLDVATIEWLEDYLVSDFGGALLLITHDRAVLERVAERTLELDGGQLYEYSGGWEAYLVGKEARLAHDARREANRQNTLRRELDWLRRSPAARTTKSQARVDRVVALRDEESAAKAPAAALFEFEATRSGKTIIELADLRVSLGGRLLIDGLELSLRAGDRVGIIGDNGIGKTSLLRVLLGQLAPDSGRVTIGKNAEFAYFDQERADLDDDRTVEENVADGAEEVLVAGSSVKTVSYLSRLLFPPDKQRQKVGSLSGGERARVAMAVFLLSKANVLLLDEPTNDLDVATLSAMEELLIDSGATVLFVTHDRYFLDRVATSVLSFEGGGEVVRYADSRQALTSFRAKKLAQAAERTAPATRPTKAAPEARAPRPGLTFTEAYELERMMPSIAEAEEALATVEKELADPDLYARRGADVPAIIARREAAQKLVDERLARWELLENKRAQTDD